MSAQVLHGAGDLLFGQIGVGPSEHVSRLPTRGLQQFAVAQQIGHAKVRHACLLGTEELAGAALLQVEFGNLESILSAHHGFERNFAAGHQNAVRLCAAASDAPAQLMQLRETETLGVLHDHDVGVGHIHANLDDSSRDQHINFAALKAGHGCIFFFGAHAPMQQANAQAGEFALAKLLVHLDGSLQFAFHRAFFDHGIHDVGLPSCSDLFAHELPDFLRALIADAPRGDGRASRRKLIQDAGVEIAVQGEREGAGNRRGRHHQHVGLGFVRLLHQAEALQYAEAMLFVHDHQPQLVELDRLLNECVGADHQLRVALRDVMACLLFSAGLLRAGKQHNAVAGGLENAAGGEVMLRRQNFGGRHQGGLVAVLHRDDSSFQRNNGLARADVSLQQAPHGNGLGHIVGNLFQHALLRRRRMEGQNSLHRIAYAAANLESDPRLSAHLPALEVQPGVEERKVFEDEADVRRSARRLQVRQALTHLRPVGLPESATAIDQAHVPADHSGDRVGRVLVKALQHGVDHAPEPARRKTAIAGSFVNGDDATDLERLPLGFVASAVAVGSRIVQNLKLGLDNFEAVASTIARFHLAVQRQQHAGAKLVLQVGGVEPHALQRVTPLADGHLEDGHAARAEQSEGAHLGDDAGHLAGAQLANATGIEPVFVAEGQIVKQVLDGADALFQQNLGNLWPNAFDELYVGGEIEHRRMVNQQLATSS